MFYTITIGNISVSAYWTMLILGAVSMGMCLHERKNRYGLAAWQCVALTVLLTVVGVAGAKTLFILENLQDTMENGISLGGVSFFGSVFLIPLIMPLVGRAFRQKGSATMDLCGPCVAIMIACMRFGCFLSGCCGGWEAQIGAVCFTWPTQAMEIVWDLAIVVMLLCWESRGKFSGALYPMFMVLYSSVRFFIEFLRDTPKDLLMLSRGQWYSLAAVAAGAAWVAMIHRAKERSPGYE